LPSISSAGEGIAGKTNARPNDGVTWRSFGCAGIVRLGKLEWDVAKRAVPDRDGMIACFVFNPFAL